MSKIPLLIIGGPTPIESLKDRVKQLQFRIQRAAEKSGRSAADIHVVAVTKTVPVERILEWIEAGGREIGENKVQEADAKREALKAAGLRHHFIGHLQRNKVRRAVELFDVIQSMDSPRLTEAVDRVALENGKKQDCLIEIKISEEPTKTGITLDEASDFVKDFHSYKNLNLLGLMTIGAAGAGLEKTRVLFKNFNSFFQEHKKYFGNSPILSMGMSDDFEIAIEEGSNMIRIGRALFGERRV